MNDPVSLSEKLYLLGIHPQKGGTFAAAATARDYILTGSLILELYQHQKIRFENRRIIVLDAKSENPLHSFLLDKMNTTNRPLKIGQWINKFHFSSKSIRRQIQKNLTGKRLIRMKERHFLFFRWNIPVLIQNQFMYHLVTEVDASVFKGTHTEEDLFLISLIEPAGLLRRIFPGKERRREAKKRMKKVMTDNQVSVAVAEAIAAAQAVAASITTITAATTAATA